MAESMSKLSAKCKACPKVDECNYKEMELCAVADLPPQISANAGQISAVSATMPLMREQIKSPLSPFKYKDELEKALQEAHFGYGNGFMYGA